MERLTENGIARSFGRDDLKKLYLELRQKRRNAVNDA
jgi:hypothetical protein